MAPERLESTSLLSVLPQTQVTLVESTFDDKLLDFEVFKHYMAVLQEKNSIRQLKSTLLT